MKLSQLKREIFYVLIMCLSSCSSILLLISLNVMLSVFCNTVIFNAPTVHHFRTKVIEPFHYVTLNINMNNELTCRYVIIISGLESQVSVSNKHANLKVKEA